jgi:hypothetical protein
MAELLLLKYPVAECMSNSTCYVTSDDHMSILMKDTDIEQNARADQVVTMQLDCLSVSDITMLMKRLHIYLHKMPTSNASTTAMQLCIRKTEDC